MSKKFSKILFMGYPLVNIVNSTNYPVSGVVYYVDCKNDDFTIDPLKSWEAKSRGICLLSEITADVQMPGSKIEATPYQSSGTSYSQFVIYQTGDSSFEVSRRVTLTNDGVSDESIASAEMQK
jgi:hypothetical protein